MRSTPPKHDAPRTDFEGRSIDLDALRDQARISDHALLRLIERVYQVDVEKLRKAMLTDAVLQAMALKATKVRLGDHELILAAHTLTVTTVLTAPAHVRRSRRRKPRLADLQGLG